MYRIFKFFSGLNLFTVCEIVSDAKFFPMAKRKACPGEGGRGYLHLTVNGTRSESGL